MQIMKNTKLAPSLGIIRLDYDYPAAPGDIDHPGSFEYDVYYRVVPGFTFEMCQSGKMTEVVEKNFIKALKYLQYEKKVNAITGDCGFMMFFQDFARKHTTIPILMSALAQLPAVTCAFSEEEEIIIMTANGKTLEPMRDLIRKECGVDTQKKRFNIIGCEDVDGFEAVALGEKVDVEKCTPGIVAKAKQALENFPKARCFLLECTELPPYADSIRKETGLPVFDAITNANYFISGFQDNKNFGEDFQDEWDGIQDDYHFGDNLDEEDLENLVNKK